MKLVFAIFSLLFAVTLTQEIKQKDRLITGSETEDIAGQVSKTWVTERIFLNGVEVTGLNDPCNRNDLTIFFRNGKLIYEEGATKCDPNDPTVIEELNWKLSNDGQALMLGSSSNAAIIKLSPTELILEEEQEGTVFREHLKPV